MGSFEDEEDENGPPLDATAVSEGRRQSCAFEFRSLSCSGKVTQSRATARTMRVAATIPSAPPDFPKEDMPHCIR